MKYCMGALLGTHAVFVLVLLFPDNVLGQQGLNNLWLGGYENEAAPPWGAVKLEFGSGQLMISTPDRDIDFTRTNANITQANGEILFSTNGAYLANATGDTLLNGTGLNPSNYTSMFPEGLLISQACLILPKPERSNFYHLFHGTIDNQITVVAEHLYVTTIDMDLDDGLGGVVTKNQSLLDDNLNEGRITAVRHANGRDWWVFCHKANSNLFYRFLVTPHGISMDGTQSIGINRPPDHGQVCFSPDGTKFAYYWGYIDDLEIFNFDRCTGLFSDPVHILIDDYDQMGGVAFSPNSRYLYVSSVEDVYQYDTEAADIESSMVHIAHWDGFYSPSPPFATLFDIAQLAPDGKIYIGTGNSTLHLHVIHDPDEGGFACNMQQHGIELPRYFVNSLPNHPNYHLGPVDGSICDSLGINNSVISLSLEEGVRVHPNPSTGRFTLNYTAHAVEGWLEVLDAGGRIIHRRRLAQWTTVHQLDLTGQAPGMYHCRLSWGGQSATTRLIIQQE